MREGFKFARDTQYAGIEDRHHITCCRSTKVRCGEAAGADRFRRDVGQCGQLHGRSGRADRGIALEDGRPVGERA